MASRRSGWTCVMNLNLNLDLDFLTPWGCYSSVLDLRVSCEVLIDLCVSLGTCFYQFKFFFSS